MSEKNSEYVYMTDIFKQIEHYKYTSTKLLEPLNNYEEVYEDFFNYYEDDTQGIYLK